MPFLTVTLNRSSVTETYIGVPNTITVSAYDDAGHNLQGAGVLVLKDGNNAAVGTTDINGQVTIGNQVFNTTGQHTIGAYLQSNSGIKASKSITVYANNQTASVTLTSSNGTTTVTSSQPGPLVIPTSTTSTTTSTSLNTGSTSVTSAQPQQTSSPSNTTITNTPQTAYGGSIHGVPLSGGSPSMGQITSGATGIAALAIAGLGLYIVTKRRKK